MLYLKVLWKSKEENHPSTIYTEIDADGWESRKVEKFRDGHKTFADLSTSTGSTMLADQKVDSRKIQNSSNLEVLEISAAEFEQAWESRQ
ncbi:DUF6881 domain-containing protein [Streptomyces kroppenstedtii]|uniref:DUF6881 domain-containing protein n=1 Tax=Streptomyces kroppenstedtii TaxID=3051181 RepID=UPI0028D45A45|nr:hypothetical protein [Streptomyces sp. DSM 40484]